MESANSSRANHRLFEKYPLDAETTIHGETLSSPYHVYDGTVLFAGCTANADSAASLLSAEELEPLLDSSGRALAALWVTDFTEANLGPHRELQVSLFATRKPGRPVDSHPFAIMRALTSNPETRMVCHGLWNDSKRVVDYNREHLGLDAHLAESSIERSPDRFVFRFVEPGGNSIASGDLKAISKQAPGPIFSMLGHIGLGAIWRGIRDPIVHVPVVNTKSETVRENRVAHTYTKSDQQTIRYFESTDRIEIEHPRYSGLQLKPEFVQCHSGVRFVYMRPVDERL